MASSLARTGRTLARRPGCIARASPTRLVVAPGRVRQASSRALPSQQGVSWQTLITSVLIAAAAAGGVSTYLLRQPQAASATPEKERDLEGYLAELAQEHGFGESQIVTDASDLDTHGKSPWSYHPAHNPSAVVYPERIEQVQALVRLAHRYGITLVPFAGGTSLEAHWATPEHGRDGKRKRTVVSVDFALMDRIGDVNVDDGDVEVEAGVKYEDLNDHLKSLGIPLFFPVDPGPGAAIGGMMATGGSGTGAVRYGTMKGDYVLNATVVLPSGEVIKTRSRARKSSAGPDLTKLFLGSEGCLGFIVKATLRLAPLLPTSIAVVPFPSVRDACSAAQNILAQGVGVQCIELLDDTMLQVINRATAANDGPSSSSSSSSSSKGEIRHLEKPSLFIKLQGNDVHRREDERRVRAIAAKWGCRDRDIKGKKCWTTDVCVPISKMADLFEWVRQETTKNDLFGPLVGHVGDGNAHSLIVFQDGDEAEFKRVQAFVHRMVDSAHELEGTCTGEHGIGRGKRMYLKRELGEGSLRLLHSLKDIIDPSGIMNPGALLYEDAAEEEAEKKDVDSIHAEQH
ncbi:hypothetical protein L7F22_014639 [Adiantum nelumboides]|nr:hypothetical protein [Adiantum nelumboides]